jgi:hypothetical protein
MALDEPVKPSCAIWWPDFPRCADGNGLGARISQILGRAQDRYLDVAF